MADEKGILGANVRDLSDSEDNHGHGHIYHSTSTTSSPRSVIRSAVDYIRGEWRASAKYGLLSKSRSPSSRYPKGIEIVLSVIAAPRFRRYVLVYCLLLFACWFGWTQMVAPRLKEHEELMMSLDASTMEEAGGWFGTNSLPRFTDMVHMKNLDASMVPGNSNRRRLVVVGDVNGHSDELEELLEKIAFDSANGDHLVFTGNMVSDNPKSTSIVEIARNHHASCVRGINEDRVLLVHRQMSTSNMVPLAGPTESPMGGGSVDHMDQESFSHGDYKERAVASVLAKDQINWLESCPAILRVGQIKGMGEVVVVHGGLVPGVELASQDPASVMNMRTIDLKTHVPSTSEDGMPWFKMFNKYQTLLFSTLKKASADTAPPESRTTTVLHGHGLDGSLELNKYTKGLDTGCHRGGKLTAMIISDGGRQETAQVWCKAAS